MAHGESKFFSSVVANATLSITAIVLLTIGAANGQDISLNMEGNTATIPKGNTVTRKIFNIPEFGGTLKLRYKWHAVNIIPNTFNALKVLVQKGPNTLNSKTACYSTHANKTPKCDVTLTISDTLARSAGDWNLVVTNNSNDEVVGFDITKGDDLNFLVPNFKSIYTLNCPPEVRLDLEGDGTTTITKGGTVTRKVFRVGDQTGAMVLKAKWHAVNILPVFPALKIELLRPDGSIRQSGNFYSLHASSSPKFNFSFSLTAAEAAIPGDWALRITNNSNYEVIGFNILKESADLNPAVPAFNSTYKVTCP